MSGAQHGEIRTALEKKKQELTARLRTWQRALGDEAPLEVERPAGGR